MAASAASEMSSRALSSSNGDGEVGGRFANHEEVIGAGEYSDDTQLIAAVSRSLLAGSDWWSRWTRSELPFWLLYERGGGGATKRAAQAWTKGTPPWTGETRDRYFSAGGNGVAMRVLPHLLRRDGGFAEAAQAIVADGIATHGHPRALVGAQAYAFALWSALRRQQRLAYGALLEEVRNGVDVWSVRPSVDDVAPDWARAAKTAMEGAYDDIWEATVGEIADLLDACLEGIGQGALSIDRETLAKLGTFDKRVSSAGTVTAAGAIFLASRYASRPAQGLVAAAFAEGADTDTLGSMTGGLLAAISGGTGSGERGAPPGRPICRAPRTRAGRRPSGAIALVRHPIKPGHSTEVWRPRRSAVRWRYRTVVPDVSATLSIIRPRPATGSEPLLSSARTDRHCSSSGLRDSATAPSLQQRRTPRPRQRRARDGVSGWL